MNKAIFVDRDGTITDETYYPNFFSQNVRILEDNIGEILQKFRNNGYLVIVITNQAGIDKGYYTEKDFWDFMREVEKQLNFKFDGIYFCPYHPDYSGDNSCRKPNNGMILQAQKDFNITLKASFVVGNSEKDIRAGKKSGCKTILYNTQNTSLNNLSTKPDYIANNWLEIEKFILK